MVVKLTGGEGNPLDPGDYCRRIESYLCRKNDGHLVRIVGPSFERVTRWATLGIPLKVAFQGIDRAFDRYYATNRRRRPVHIDFCEADVLASYDAWRRAVGAAVADAAHAGGAGDLRPTRRRSSLPAHLDRVLVRLSSFLAAQAVGPELRTLVERVALDVGGLREGVRGLRGEARREAIERLEALDRELTDGALHLAPETLLSEARAAAHAELAPLRDRMSEHAYEDAARKLRAREVRSRLQLPTLMLD